MLATGIALLVLGVALLVAEAHVVSYGALGLAGITALVAGSVFALSAAGASLAVLVAVAVVISAAAAAGLTLLVRSGVTATRRRVSTGREALIGHVGVLRDTPHPVGHVLVDGTLWNARASCLHDDDPPLEPGEPVVIESIKGLTLTVRRAEQWEIES